MRARALVVGATWVAAFSYGFAAGSYRLFPFYQVAYLKNTILSNASRIEHAYEPATSNNVVVVESALQRLLIKRLPLRNTDGEFVGGGGMSLSGGVLFVFASGGRMEAFDMQARRRLQSRVPDAPINRAELMRSRMRYEIHLPFFRLVGVHAELGADSTRTLFVYHNVYHVRTRCITANISRLVVTVRDGVVQAVGGWRTIFTTSPCMVPFPKQAIPFPGHISGGQMLDFDSRHLLVSVGDYAHDGTASDAWALDSLKPYGKFLLVDKESGSYRIYATGMRNAMGLYRDRGGVIWASESGPQGGDELNIVREGANFGWPLETFGINYDSKPWHFAKNQGRHDDLDQPAIAWLPSIVPTGLLRFDGTGREFELWKGDLLIGTLRDQSLRRLRLDRSGRVVVDERIFLGERVRSLLQLDDGTLVILTDATGNLLLIADGGPVYEALGPAGRKRIEDLERYDQLVDAGVRSETPELGAAELFQIRCASCHAIDGRNLMGPHLDGVLARRVGSADSFVYSSQLEFDGRRWTKALLIEFLLHPEKDFLNTRMPKVALGRTEADSIIEYLRRVGESVR